MKAASILIACAMCQPVFAAPPYKDGADLSGNKMALMRRDMEATRSKFKDPKAAEFRNIYHKMNKDSPPVTCGDVNAKNSFGAYTGFSRFLSAGTAELTFIESEVEGFGEVWAKFCQ